MGSPLTVTNGTFAAQIQAADYPPLIQRIEIGLAATCEFILNTLSSSTTNYADVALMARYIGSNPGYWANALAPLIVADGTVTTSSTDQNIADQIWLLWPVISYKTATIYPNGPITP